MSITWTTDDRTAAHAERDRRDRRAMLTDPRWAARLRRATDAIGRGTYTGPDRRASADRRTP